MNNEWKIFKSHEIRDLRKIFLGEKLVITGGYFDPIHRGHVRLIRDSKSCGEKLVVCVNNDAATRKKKGYCLLPVMDRMITISHMIDVGAVLEIDDVEMYTTLSILKPSVYCKGGDRTEENMVQSEIDVCGEIGCEIKYGVGGFDKNGSSSDFFKRAFGEYFNNNFREKCDEIIRAIQG